MTEFNLPLYFECPLCEEMVPLASRTLCEVCGEWACDQCVELMAETPKSHTHRRECNACLAKEVNRILAQRN
jgi:hypothetical protein